VAFSNARGQSPPSGRLEVYIARSGDNRRAIPGAGDDKLGVSGQFMARIPSDVSAAWGALKGKVRLSTVMAGQHPSHGTGISHS